LNINAMGTFQIKNSQFWLDDQPFRILAGAMHYFRIPPEYWDNRMYKLRAMGLNTLETYIAWNLHEPRPGEFHFDGGLDVVKYIQLAANYGLRVIVRPGPYICSEWDFGGLPAWLLKDPQMQVRCSYPPYLHAVDRYLGALLPQLAPLQVSHGGPVIAMQVENEYGSYGNDKAYLRHLVDEMRAQGIDCLLFTSDGEMGEQLEAGTLPDIYKTVNFAHQPSLAFGRLQAFQPGFPLMCTEYWTGWFDHWGERHHVRPADEAAATLDEILAANASVSLYMFHGGTNFGFMNGANLDGTAYLADVTSYDYDAPLTETGDPTPKYFAFQQVIGKYASLPDLPLPSPTPRLRSRRVELTESVGLFDGLEHLSTPVSASAPLSMEALDQDYGFILYRTRLPESHTQAVLTLRELHDRAQIFVEGQPVGVLERATPDPTISLNIPAGGARLDILVENMGRVNSRWGLMDRKGILGGVLLGPHFLFDWMIYTLPLSDLSRLAFRPARLESSPGFYQCSFRLDQPLDTFLGLPGWTKGVAWINGFNLGRYWKKGPQRRLYIPAPLLRSGENRLILFEQHGTSDLFVELCDQPDLGEA
jgi:beta-galactosidase